MHASSAADPGVTGSSILIGGTVPLSGEASSGGLTAKGADAFFKSTNAHKGVFNRKINYDYKDDAYDPAKTIQATRELVQQDHVFAIFNPLGTAQNIATRPFLNSLGVPQLFVASGWGGWARDAKQFPLTIGVIPTYTGEAIVYGALHQGEDQGREDRCPLPGRRVRARAAERAEEGARLEAEHDREPEELRPDLARRLLADLRSSRPPGRTW